MRDGPGDDAVRSSTGSDGNPDASSPPPPLELRLELRREAPRPAGTVVLLNRGPGDVRVWGTGNRWGDTALSFQVVRGGEVRRVTREPGIYTRNVPSAVTIHGGGTLERPFDLADGRWSAETPLERLLGPGSRLVAVWGVPPSSEAAAQGVWTGIVRSEPVPLGGPERPAEG